MFGQDRTQLRRFFVSAWQKQQQAQPLEPLERLVAAVIAQHPEYQPLLREDALDRDWTPEQGETNPFLHMGMHITLAEQLGSDRPPGVRALYQQIVQHQGDAHAAEHRMMDCLGLVLWEAQRAGRPPDEAAFLECLRRLVG
ncbi:MAG: hypothetical protein RLZ44_442 [Pseudomonadota bacterium]|jgi:hypothetical protein